jgi:hypothetical protein
MAAAKQAMAQIPEKQARPVEKVTEAYAFVCINERGEERQVSIQVGDTWVPLFCLDFEALPRIRALAQDLARQSGRTIRLLRFTRREQLEVIEP